MTVEAWKSAAIEDAKSRNLPDLVPLIEMLARAIEALRKADWNEDASGGARKTKA